MMMFGFEVDTLEISLREQLDWVDMVFLVEATTTTKGVSGKKTKTLIIYNLFNLHRWPSLSCGKG